jgi:flagellar hook protein FlgE
MANSLLTGVSGLRAHQQMLDVVGHNLANTNTTGYKAQRLRFSDLVYQTLNPASAPTDTIGGVNPQQVGLGVRTAAIDVNLQQGSLEATQNVFDLALQGAGFFVASDGVQNRFTRAGAFGVDAANHLVDPSNGFRVQRFGTVGEGSATSPAFQASGDSDIRIPIGTGIPGRTTSNISLQGNLSASALGPLAQVLTTTQPLVAGGAPATAATLLNNLDSNTVDYVAGDQIRLQGVTSGNVPVNTTIAVGPGTTLGDVLSAINAAVPDATASIDASGNIVVQANAAAPSALNLTLTEVAGNTGTTSWGNHALATTTTGKDGDTVATGIQFYDVQGAPHYVNLVFQKQAANTWNMTASIEPSEGTIVDGRIDRITFNDNGSFGFVNGVGIGDPFITVQINGMSAPQTIGFGLGSPNSFDGLMQVGGTSSAVARDQDGFAAGFLTDVAVSQDGVINGIFTNGQILPVAQLAIATFANPAALLRDGGNYLAISAQSGEALIGAGLAGGRGSVQQKALESSNVDVALEFTRMIIAQRGFQVNARTITASDEVLEELANIVR